MDLMMQSRIGSLGLLLYRFASLGPESVQSVESVESVESVVNARCGVWISASKNES